MDLKDFRYVGEKPNLKKIPQNAYGFGVEKEDKEKYVVERKHSGNCPLAG